MTARHHLLTLLGPGILIAATGIGAGDLATAAFTGNKLGVGILWAVVLGAFLKFVLNEGLARWQLATGETLLEGAVRRLGRPVRIVFLPYLLLWTFFVGSALMAACGAAMHAILPVFADASHGKVVFGILHSLLGLALVWIGGFQLFEKVMKVCIAVMFVTVVATACLVCEDWGLVARGLLVPSIPEGQGEGLGWTIALMGGVGGTLTVLCYGYWMREKGRGTTDTLKITRIDLGCAYLLTAVFGMSMVIIGSTIEVSGKGAGLVVNLAGALEEPLGTAGKWVFLLGAWGALFSSLLGVWQAVPYVFADYLRLVRNRNDQPAVSTSSRAYRGYLVAIALVPMLGLVVSFSGIQKIYAVFGALFMPMLAVVLLILNRRSNRVHALCNHPATIAVLTATLVLFTWFGTLKLGKVFGF